jgi:hypothetical protein
MIGLPGVCIAFVLAEFAVAATAYPFIPRDLRDLWKNPLIPVAVFSSLLMVLAVRWVNHYSSRPLIVVAAGAAVYAAAATVLGGKLLINQFGESK